MQATCNVQPADTFLLASGDSSQWCVMASDSDTEPLLSEVDDEELGHVEPEPEVQAVKVSSRKPSLHASLNAPGNGALVVGGAIALVVAGLAGFLLKRLLRPKKKARLPPSKRVPTTPKKRRPTAAPASPAGTAAQGSKASVASSSRTTPTSSPAKPASVGPKLPLRPALPQRPARKPAQATSPAAPAAPAAVATPATPALAPRSAGPAAVPERPAAAPAASVAPVEPVPAAATSAAPLPTSEPAPAAAPAVENGMELRIPPPPRSAEPAEAASAPEVEAPAPERLSPVEATPAPEGSASEPEGAAARPAVTSQLHADAKPFFPSFAAAEPAVAATAVQEQRRQEGEEETAALGVEAPVVPNGSAEAARYRHQQQEGADGAEEAQALAADDEAGARQNGGAGPSAAGLGESTSQEQQEEPSAPVVKGKKAREPKPQEPEQEESIHDYPVPALSFEGSPTQDSELTALEHKARQMSIHAHKLLQARNVPNAYKEQKAVVEMLVAPESAGNFRPALLVNCCLALADMTLALRKFAETKKWLALAHAAGAYLPVKGAMVQALLNYGFVVKQEGKPQSALRAYQEAARVGEEAFGLVHSTVQKARYELIAHLVKMEREDEAMDLLVSGADQLLAKAEELEQEEKQQQGDKPAVNGESKGDDTTAAAASSAEQGQAAEAAEGPAGEGDAEGHEEGKEMPRSKMARHFAVRSLLNAAGVLDTKQQFEKGEELLKRAQQITVDGYGENSMAAINVLSAMAQHYKRQGRTDAAIEFYEQVLGVMDEHIEVYDPDMLRERVVLLNETAVLLKQVGRFEEALDYATGALVNCQTLLSVMTEGRPVAGHPMLEQFHVLLAEIKQQMGDEEGAAESRRAALHGRLSFQQQRGRGGRGGARGGAAGGRSSKRTSTTAASTTRAGGRRK